MFHLFTKIDSISTSELEAKLKEPIQLLDVRTPTEFRRGHIKNAKNVPLTEIGSYKPTTKETLYVICHSGVRSKMAAKKLKKKGYDVINVRGGMRAWTGKYRPQIVPRPYGRLLAMATRTSREITIRRPPWSMTILPK